MIVTKERGTGKSERGESHDPGDRLSTQLVSVRGEEVVFTEPQTGTGQKLATKEVKEHRGDMRRLAVLVHGTNFPFEKELGARREGVNVGGCQHCDTARGQEMANVAQEADRALDMLDDFDGCHKAERCGTKLRGKVPLVEIQAYMRHLAFVAS